MRRDGLLVAEHNERTEPALLDSDRAYSGVTFDP
jgi:hypothetical protein